MSTTNDDEGVIPRSDPRVHALSSLRELHLSGGVGRIHGYLTEEGLTHATVILAWMVGCDLLRDARTFVRSIETAYHTGVAPSVLALGDTHTNPPIATVRIMGAITHRTYTVSRDALQTERYTAIFQTPPTDPEVQS